MKYLKKKNAAADKITTKVKIIVFMVFLLLNYLEFLRMSAVDKKAGINPLCE